MKKSGSITVFTSLFLAVFLLVFQVLLQSVQIGADSLVSVRELELNGLWNLNQFEIGERGLIGVERVVLKDANMKMLSSFVCRRSV